MQTSLSSPVLDLKRFPNSLVRCHFSLLFKYRFELIVLSRKNCKNNELDLLTKFPKYLLKLKLWIQHKLSIPVSTLTRYRNSFNLRALKHTLLYH